MRDNTNRDRILDRQKGEDTNVSNAPGRVGLNESTLQTWTWALILVGFYDDQVI